MNNTRLDQLEQELTAIKRSARKWRGATTLLLIGAGLFAADAVGPTVIDHLVVRKLDVISDDGHSVLSLAQTETGGQIDLYSADGTNLLRLGTNESGGDMALWNRDGTSVAGLWSTKQGGTFNLWNNQGENTLGIETGSLTLNSPSSKSKLVLEAVEKSSGLAFVNANGMPVIILGTDEKYGTLVQLANQQGQAVAELRTIPGLGGAIVLKTASDKKAVLLAATDEGGSFNLMNSRGVPVVIGSTSDANGGAISIANERGMGVITVEADGEQRGALNVSDADGNGTRRIRPLRGYAP
ncbi:hypothetical protein H8D29_06380 [PVC group bacterium]|nr:hypothetical protein [PVC group bacterium]